MLQQRSKHPREIVITPKASISLSLTGLTRFLRWGTHRFGVRVRFTSGSEFTRDLSETPRWSYSGFDGFAHLPDRRRHELDPEHGHLLMAGSIHIWLNVFRTCRAGRSINGWIDVYLAECLPHPACTETYVCLRVHPLWLTSCLTCRTGGLCTSMYVCMYRYGRLFPSPVGAGRAIYVWIDLYLAGDFAHLSYRRRHELNPELGLTLCRGCCSLSVCVCDLG